MSNLAALTQAISLTNEILEVLEEKDFDRISELDARREPLIKLAFTASIEQIDVIKARHLQNLNQQVVEKLNEFKQFVLVEQERIRSASKASRAYESHLP